MYRLLAGLLLMTAGIAYAKLAEMPEYEILKSSYWEFRSADEGRIIYTKPGILQWWTDTGREIADSLVLPWPEDSFTGADDVVLAFSASIRSGNDTTYIQFSEKRNGDSFLLPFPYTTTLSSLPHSESPNCLTITDSVTVSSRDFRIRGDSLIIRVLNETPETRLSLLSITELSIDDGSSRKRMFPLPSISGSFEQATFERIALPRPLPLMGQWILWYDLDPPGFDPCVLNGSFVLRQDARYAVPNIDMRMECNGNRYDFQPKLKDSFTIFTGYLKDHQSDESSMCRLYLLIPASSESGDQTVLDSLWCAFRSTWIHAGDLVINEIIHSPNTGLSFELRNLKNWPLEIADATLSIQSTRIPLTIMDSPSIEDNGYLWVTTDIHIDLSQPPEHLEIRLWTDSTCIDSLAIGILDSMPIPPDTYSLSRTGNAWIIESRPTPEAENTIPDYGETVREAIILSELHLWDGAESTEFVELMNTGQTEVNIAGWKLVANEVFPVQFDTLIAPGKPYVIRDIPESFGFESEYGSLYLIDRNGGIIDRHAWSNSPFEGRSFHRLLNDARDTIICEEGIPSPGHIYKMNVSPREVHVTHTHNGIVVQWACGQPDTSAFDIYRSESGTGNQPVRVSTFPVVGMDPFSFVDLTADPDTDYSYWLVRRIEGFKDVWFGPYDILRERGTKPISVAVPRPNPFSDVLCIEFDIGTLTDDFLASVETDYRPGHRMTLAVYSIDGRLVKTLDKDILLPGSYTARWDGTNELGMRCPPGVYLVSLQLGPYTESVRTVFMKEQ